ncbi:hypothetical protein SK128_005846 [Halocaridina rubra]|uniref:Uncharacterized protein n=1 Tax=Halocaridina rubra TaxID=373956 RepID=A0AAN8XFV3_HALRR
MPLLTSDRGGARTLDLTPQSRRRYRLSHGDYNLDMGVGGLHGQTVRRTRFDKQVFEVMFERVNGVFGLQPNTPFTRSNITSKTCLSNHFRRTV